MLPNKPYLLFALPVWKCEDAETQFGEVVRRSQEIGPQRQRVALDGQDAVVVLSAADYARLAPSATVSLVELFGNGPFAALDELEPLRERSPVHDLPSWT